MLQQDHLEGLEWHPAGVAVLDKQRAVADIASGVGVGEPRRRNGHAAPVSGDRVPHCDLETRPVEEERNAVAAPDEVPEVAAGGGAVHTVGRI